MPGETPSARQSRFVRKAAKRGRVGVGVGATTAARRIFDMSSLFRGLVLRNLGGFGSGKLDFAWKDACRTPGRPRSAFRVMSARGIAVRLPNASASLARP